MDIRNRVALVLIAIFIQVLNLSACNPDDTLSITKESKECSSSYIAIFGDIQHYTNANNIDTYRHTIDWLYEMNKNGMDLRCVLHTGDITHNNKDIQWQFFYDSTYELASVVPYISMIGDHDYTWDSIYINDRYSTLFNDYVKFPLTKQRVISQFEEGRMENVVIENTIHGERFDLLVLEFGPRVEVVEWANQHVKSHPEIKYILLNHEYLEKGGRRRTRNLKCRRLLNTTYTTPNELWNRLIKGNDNIRCVLCGHVGGLYALTVEENDFGREIPQIQHNIQGSDYRYDNWLMLWEFPADRDSVNVCIYNTKTGQYYNNNQHCLFKFKYRDLPLDTKVGCVSPSFTKRLLYDINGLPTGENIRGIRIIKGERKMVKVVF